jgi:hypothetical protein
MTEHKRKEIREKAEQTIRFIDGNNESILMSTNRIYSDQRTILALLDEIEREHERKFMTQPRDWADLEAESIVARTHTMGSTGERHDNQTEKMIATALRETEKRVRAEDAKACQGPDEGYLHGCDCRTRVRTLGEGK